jgi:hypothetical protein
MYKDMYNDMLMCVFCDRLKFGSTAALNCRSGQSKGRYCKKELLLLLVLFLMSINNPIHSMNVFVGALFLHYHHTGRTIFITKAAILELK